MKLENAREASDQAGSKPVDDTTRRRSDCCQATEKSPPASSRPGNEHGDGNGGSQAGEGETPRPGPSLIDGNDKGSRTGQQEGNRRRRRAVFSLVRTKTQLLKKPDQDMALKPRLFTLTWITSRSKERCSPAKGKPVDSSFVRCVMKWQLSSIRWFLNMNAWKTMR